MGFFERGPARAGTAARRRRLASAALLTAVTVATVTAASAAAVASPPVLVADPALAAIVARHQTDSERRSFFARMQRGQLVERIPALSREEAREDAAAARRHLAALARISPAKLTEDDRVTYEVLAWSLRQRVHLEKWWWYEFSVTTYTTWDLNAASQALAANPLDGDPARAAYLSLLESIATRLATSAVRLDAQAKRGIRLPAPTAEGAIPYFEAVCARHAGLPDEAGKRATAVDDATRARFVAAVRGVVDRRLGPACSQVLDRLRIARTQGPSTVGLGQYPGGRDVYRDLVRLHTSVDATPEDVMAYGEARVRRINAEIDRIAREVRIEGGRDGLRRMLRTDPRFLAKTPDDVATRYMQAMARLMPHVPTYFSKQPRAPFGVRRVDPAAEGSMTFGFYQPPTAATPTGEYRFNGSRLEDRPLLFAAPIIYHELVPGHHFQIALQLENEGLPEFRRRPAEFSYNAYTEGWAEYAAELAGEMGLYDDPYDRLGRLMLDAFLSVRLVVDPGMNYFGWSLEKARQYMRDNTFQSETEILTETVRYSTAIPGQALGYKMGHRVLDELRAEVSAKQGASFDVRAFHDAVLDGGAMPLTVLQGHVRRRFGLAAP